MEVNTAHAPNVDLSQYKTFSWVPDGKPQDSIIHQEIRAISERQLKEKGLTPSVPGNSPDLLLSYSESTELSYEYGGLYDHAEYGFWGMGSSEVFPIRKGTISLSMSDPKVGKVVWEGKATDVIGNGGETEDQVKEAVKDIFEKYPLT